MAGQSLTVFERRFGDWSITHPRRGVAITDTDAAARFISEQTQQIRRAQLEAADRIIVSQDRIAGAVDGVGVAVERVTDGLEGLEAAFEWGFSEIVWHLEQQREVLKDILKVLQAPLNTQAKELRKRAEEAYRNGWIDDALDDFLESERKNRYDFTVLHSIGSIYLFHKKVPERAVEYFEKAAKYATPKSPYHASLALLNLGLVKYLQEDFQGAYEAAKKATQLSPKLDEGNYECARYCARLGQHREAIERLRLAIERDRDYCLKAGSERDFDSMRERLHSFFSGMLAEAQQQAKDEMAKLQEIITYSSSFGVPSADHEDCEWVKKARDDAEQLVRRESLLDTWDAIGKIWDIQEGVLCSLEDSISSRIRHTDHEKHAIRGGDEPGTLWASCVTVYGIISLIVVLGSIFVGAYLFASERGTHGGVFTIIAGGLACGLGAGVGMAMLFIVWTLFCGCLVEPLLAPLLEARCDRRRAKLDRTLSEMKSKWGELNWHYVEKDE